MQLEKDVKPVEQGGWLRLPVGVSWTWQLQGELKYEAAVDLYDIDLFDTDAEVISDLKKQGKIVICYFSGGTYEDWREDAEYFAAEALGNNLDEWEGERWLDIRDQSVVDVMLRRLDLAQAKGCDGVEPDNIDGYANNSGFNLTADDQLAFNRMLANEAHKRGLAIALKNDLDQVDDLVDYFDFAVNEQCHEYEECEALLPFIMAGKPVLNAEYADHFVEDANARARMFNAANNARFSTLVLPLDLDGSFRISSF
ncbi:MAG: endo alpha-1,4 polygalactosaminidase [Thiolinea sp.]